MAIGHGRANTLAELRWLPTGEDLPADWIDPPAPRPDRTELRRQLATALGLVAIGLLILLI